MYQKHLIFDIIDKRYELHDLIGNQWYSCHCHCYFPKIADYNKEKMKGSNHFKVHILDSLI